MTRNLTKLFRLSLAGAVMAALAPSAAGAQESFAGKSVQFIIGFGAGGGYDTYSRVYARHAGRHLPGNPTLVPRNMPGAGSIRAADYLYFNAPKDGTAIGMIGDGLYLSQQVGESKIRFDTLKFNWIGRLTNNTPVLFAWHQSSIHSTADVLTKQMIVNAEGATPKTNYMLLHDLIGVNMKVISGYKGSNEALLAMERGEIDGLAMPWPVVLSKHGAWVKEKKIVPVLQTGAEKHEALPNIPRMIDLAKNEDDKKLFEFIAQPSRIGRAVVAPPDLAAAVLKTHRDAFMATMKDKEFLAEVERSKLDLAVLDGEQLATAIAKDGTYPKQIVDRARAVVQRVSAQNKKKKKK
ncbi:MAG: Bug family tripartite tricarboxylate transporter substrate binding protein [Alphaproteobacteria bacterium]